MLKLIPMGSPIVFDVETQKIFQEVNNDVSKLGVSVVVAYDYAEDRFKTFFEKDLPQLFQLFEKASMLIGFNSNKFDLEVLKPYYVGDLTKFPSLDLLEEVQKNLGKRIALDDLVKGTLGKRKEGHGFLAINYFREGKFAELAKYCQSDVRLTRDLYEYGKKNEKVYYFGAFGKVEIKVNWKDIKVTNELHLTLPM